MNNVVFEKTMENLRKKQIYQACNNRSVKKLFSVGTELSNKNFFQIIYQ